ncbi:hypothetical protein [Rhizobium lusitanum]|nr:hypothetical protein [Rhizobium lusitanum]MBM7048388.1 hypothetical protein [Rhizobium lusitanum]
MVWTRDERLQEQEGLEVFAFAGLVYIAISLPIAGLSRYVDDVVRAKVA